MQTNVAVLADTPSMAKTVLDAYGPRFYPAYGEIYYAAWQKGQIVAAEAFVNDGAPKWIGRDLTHSGFKPVFPHAPDVDEAAIATAVRLHKIADVIILCTHDGHFIPVVQLLKGKVRLVLCAVRKRCHGTLLAICDEFIDAPIRPAWEVKKWSRAAA